MLHKTLLKKMTTLLLLLWGTATFSQQVERLPVKSDEAIIAGKSASPAAQVVAQPPVSKGAHKGAGTLASAADILVNNNNGATSIGGFTQSETSTIAWGNNVVIGYNDAGSFASGNHFTGWSYSADGGTSFTDGGTLPVSAIGDLGDPVLARNNTTGRIYFSTLGSNSPRNIQMFRSDDNGVTWMAPVNATPGGIKEDKQWVTVDNFAGGGNGSVYLLSRRFAGDEGIYFFRSTDNGATFSPNGGTLIVAGSQGAYIEVGPDHSIYAFWYAGSTLQMRRSTDQGLTFGAAVTVASGLVGGTNGNLGLTGIRQGTAVAAGFRSNEFPHAAVNPVSGHLYVTYANNPAGVDKADIFYVMSTNNGATWSAPVRVNDDATTTDQWQPTVAVSPNGQNIGFFYYSRQEDAANNLFKYYGRMGALSGATVTLAPGFAVSDVASLAEFGRDNVLNDIYMGDYNTASATATDFHVVWSDNRSDLAGGSPRKDPNVYYKKIAMPVADNQPPVITCPADITSANGAGLCSKLLTIVPATATDNSGTVTVKGVRSDALALNAPFPVGTTTILWTAKDPSNNTATCTQTIIVNDNELPVAKCKNVTVTLVNGSATITAADVNNGSTDNCAIQSVSVSKTSFNCSNAGANTVTLTVTDIHSNTKTCTATVTVVGEVPTCSIASIPSENTYTGGVPTNIYLGYGPQSTTLQVTAPASGAPYTYAWSGGTLSNYNTANPVFAPTAEGAYTFTVIVTNKYGCTGTCNITINVYDIRVPGTKGKKVYVCHSPDGNPGNKNTLEINVNAVPAHVPGHSGDQLGRCGQVTTAPVIVSRAITQMPVINIESSVVPYPNPNNGSFDVMLDNYKTGGTEIRIMSNTGRVLERRSVVVNNKRQVVHFNFSNRSAGMYYIQVITKDGVKVSKILINR